LVRLWSLYIIEVDAAGGVDEANRLLDAYLLDPDKLAHKVYYR